MRTSKIIISLVIIFLLVIAHSIVMTLIKNENFIGTYYTTEIKSDFYIEICGLSTSIIDNKSGKTIISDVDSMNVVDDVVYCISKEKYALLNLSNGDLVYSEVPIPRYSTCQLLSPKEYYNKKTRGIDIIGFVVLLCCITGVIMIMVFKNPTK